MKFSIHFQKIYFLTNFNHYSNQPKIIIKNSNNEEGETIFTEREVETLNNTFKKALLFDLPQETKLIVRKVIAKLHEWGDNKRRIFFQFP